MFTFKPLTCKRIVLTKAEVNNNFVACQLQINIFKQYWNLNSSNM